MGYYSDVGLALTKTGVDFLQSRLASPEVSKELREEVNTLLDQAERHYTDASSGAEIWYWDWIKWYDSKSYGFQDVCFIMDALDTLEDGNYRFIRIGEEYDDTEVMGGFWENPFDFELTRGMTLSEPYQPFITADTIGKTNDLHKVEQP